MAALKLIRCINWDLFLFLTVAENVCFLLVCNFLRYQKPYFDIQYSVTESRVTMGQGGSGLKFHVNF